MISDAQLWSFARTIAAETGWQDREAILSRAAAAVCKHHRIQSDDEREAVRGRLDKLWVKHMAVMDAN